MHADNASPHGRISTLEVSTNIPDKGVDFDVDAPIQRLEYLPPRAEGEGVSPAFDHSIEQRQRLGESLPDKGLVRLHTGYRVAAIGKDVPDSGNNGVPCRVGGLDQAGLDVATEKVKSIGAGSLRSFVRSFSGIVGVKPEASENFARRPKRRQCFIPSGGQEHEVVNVSDAGHAATIELLVEIPQENVSNQWAESRSLRHADVGGREQLEFLSEGFAVRQFNFNGGLEQRSEIIVLGCITDERRGDGLRDLGKELWNVRAHAPCGAIGNRLGDHGNRFIHSLDAADARGDFQDVPDRAALRHQCVENGPSGRSGSQ